MKAYPESVRAEARRLYVPGVVGHKQVARQLNVPSATVYRWVNADYAQRHLAAARALKESYRGTCLDCGSPTSGCNGPTKPSKRCAPCSAAWQKATKKWTRRAVIAAIQRFAREHGRPPFSTDWNHSGRGEGYPSASSVYGHESSPFAAWADAIEAAGFPRPRNGVYQRTAEIRARCSESQQRRRERERQERQAA